MREECVTTLIFCSFWNGRKLFLRDPTEQVFPFAHMKTNRSSFQNIVFYNYLELQTMEKVHKPRDSEYPLLLCRRIQVSLDGRYEQFCHLDYNIM
jgi:hypothetical protein